MVGKQLNRTTWLSKYGQKTVLKHFCRISKTICIVDIMCIVDKILLPQKDASLLQEEIPLGPHNIFLLPQDKILCASSGIILAAKCSLAAKFRFYQCI